MSDPFGVASAIYPFNKVAHALLHFSHLAPSGFDLVGVIDFTWTGSNRDTVSGFDSHEIEITGDISILQQAQTLVLLDNCDALPHYEESFARAKVAQKLEQLLLLAQEQHKAIVTLVPPGRLLSDITRRLDIKTVTPTLSLQGEVPPVTDWPRVPARIGIAGTGPCMGKYTTALRLTEALRSRGYNVGHIATEQSGFLLADYCVANLTPAQQEPLVPYLLQQLKDRDLIISSGQGGVLDMGLETFNAPWFLSLQVRYFELYRPHAVVLQVHTADPIEKVESAVQCLRVLGRGEDVIAFVIPAAREDRYQKYIVVDTEEIQRRREILQDRYGVPAFELLRDSDGLHQFTEHIESWLTSRHD